MKCLFASLLGSVALFSLAAAQAPTTQPTTQPARKLTVDLDKAAVVDLPKIEKDLSPTPYKTPDGKGGWVIRIPGNRPIATPAFADGLLFVGGGYGSHEFYAFDAVTGKTVWQIKTADDGPTAAVVEDGYVAFNTESCTVIVVDAKTGKLVWQEWLGDPLMSQPAISKGKLYIAYPGGNPRGVQTEGEAGARVGPAINNAAQQQVMQQQAVNVAPNAKPGVNTVGPAKGNGHRLLCANLRTGKHHWEQDITADVITAPVIDGDKVFFTCFDGTSFCLNADTGEVIWKKAHAGQSAPLIAEGKVVVTEKVAAGEAFHEGIKRLDPAGGKDIDQQLLAQGEAKYLKPGAEGSVALSSAVQAVQDASVGFGGGGPAVAQLEKAQANVNIKTVAGAWAYQGSRAAYNGGLLINGQANRLNCISATDGLFNWQAEAQGKGIDDSSQVFCPPALGKANMYVCSVRGEMLCLDQKEGKLQFAYNLKQPMAFQPALVGGSMYAGTTNGLLVCLQTGLPDADGWHAWGGNMQHNKKE